VSLSDLMALPSEALGFDFGLTSGVPAGAETAARPRRKYNQQRCVRIIKTRQGSDTRYPVHEIDSQLQRARAVSVHHPHRHPQMTLIPKNLEHSDNLNSIYTPASVNHVKGKKWRGTVALWSMSGKKTCLEPAVPSSLETLAEIEEPERQESCLSLSFSCFQSVCICDRFASSDAEGPVAAPHHWNACRPHSRC